MNVTLSLDEKLVKTVRKIAIDRDTTMTSLIRDYLSELARQDAASPRKRREQTLLTESFENFRFKVGKRTWKRQDLYVRS
jgi:hypothetical protein